MQTAAPRMYLGSVCAHPEKLPKLISRILSEKEKETIAPESASLLDFLRIWTKKESVFKAYDGKKFIPDGIELSDYRTKTFRVLELPELILSVSGDQIDQLMIYTEENGSLRKIPAEEMEEIL